jgi:hypothetical protein
MSRLSRRDLLRLSAAGVVGYSCSGWLQALADQTAGNRQRRSCILLWMNGGPSQMDTFDLKPGHANGGPYRAIATTGQGVRISEHLPRLARQMHHAAIIRAMRTSEGDHGQGTYLMHTGYRPQGPIQYPTLGSLVARELGDDNSALPNFVSIAPFRQFNSAAYSPGFLGPQYAPLLVGESAAFFGNPNQQQQDVGQLLRVPDLAAPSDVEPSHFDARIDILQSLQSDFVRNHSSVAAQSHQSAYDRAVRLMRTEARSAFNIDEEPASLRDAYGRNLFGQAVLLARRLVERGVPFIEVNLGSIPNAPAGWDTHGQNFDQVRRLSEVLDPAFATLLSDLNDRGMIGETTVVWMGEFGRTPQIRNGNGRDHFPNAWSTVIAGGGVRGGQVYGETSPDGTSVVGPRQIGTRDFIATVCKAMGMDHTKQNMSNVGRPIRIAEQGARPIEEILA